MKWYHMDGTRICGITARRCVLPGQFTWRLSIVLQHAQTPAQGQCFEISQTASPEP